jgi:hypothetical protein
MAPDKHVVSAGAIRHHGNISLLEVQSSLPIIQVDLDLYGDEKGSHEFGNVPFPATKSIQATNHLTGMAVGSSHGALRHQHQV